MLLELHGLPDLDRLDMLADSALGAVTITRKPQIGGMRGGSSTKNLLE